MMEHPPAPNAGPSTGRAALRVRVAGQILGPLVCAVMLAIGPPGDLSDAGWRVAAVAALMAVWWITQAVPVPVTALAPLVAFPLLGIAPIKDAAAPYANPILFLFLGGFMIALAVERWALHRRIALTVLRLFGPRPSRLVAGFMAATAGLSMWISNTATAVIMLPIGLAVIGLLHEKGVAELPAREDRNFAIALLLGIAYGASIGGIGTLIGTPPNAFLAAYMYERHGVTIGFARWMLIGIPLVLAMLPLAWLVLTRLAFPVGNAVVPGAARVIQADLDRLGPLSAAEKRVGAVFLGTAMLWMARPALAGILPGLPLSDPAIALAGAVTLFIVPADLKRGIFLLDWDWAKRLPWGVLILFGGGLSLASAIGDSGLAAWIGRGLASLAERPLYVIVLLVAALVVFMTEITSNTATATIILPVAAALAVSMALDPILLTVPVALAASCAFMMPVATPPNAIVFGSGRVTIPNMVKAGLLLNLVAIPMIALVALGLGSLVFGP